MANDILDRLRAHSGEKIGFVREAIAEIEYLRGLLEDKQYISMKADYARGHLSWANMINEREARRNK